MTLNIGDIVSITANPIPSDTTDEIIWSASNDNCTVVDGTVTAIKVGDCVITATCGEYNATCTATVNNSLIISEGLQYEHNGTVSTTTTTN